MNELDRQRFKDVKFDLVQSTYFARIKDVGGCVIQNYTISGTLNQAPIYVN